MAQFVTSRVKNGTTASPSTLAPLPAELAIAEVLFDHVPEVVFFLKDLAGRYVAMNATLVERCGRGTKRELLGRTVHDVFPAELANSYAFQDAAVMRSGRALVDRLELHWYPHRRAGWCLTTKVPLRDAAGTTVGLAGISRDLRTPGDATSIPKSLAGALAHLEEHYSEGITPVSLAEHAGLSATRFARLIKRIFRVTPSQLIANTRLAASAQLLDETKDSVAQIALACGFYDHSAFTRAFKAATGRTPTEFRQRQSNRST